MDLKYFLKTESPSCLELSADRGHPGPYFITLIEGSTFKTFVDSILRVKNSANVRTNLGLNQILIELNNRQVTNIKILDRLFTFKRIKYMLTYFLCNSPYFPCNSSKMIKVGLKTLINQPFVLQFEFPINSGKFSVSGFDFSVIKN